MLDDLREDSGELDFFDEPESEGEAYDYQYEQPKRAASRQPQFLGMTAPQRFVIAVMLLMMVCMLGTFSLLIMQKVYLPFV
ncbi:MAG: hypothetical protein JXB38_06115 [Anaerolineales bacterium]|nr:hypothetical protein [Anaerolineales bacterium]